MTDTRVTPATTAPTPSPTEPGATAARVARFRQIVVAGSLSLSAALVLVSGLINPDDTGRSEDLYQAAVDQPGSMVTAAVLLIVSSLLLVPGVVGSARLVRGRGRIAAGVAAVLGVMGAFGHVVYSTFAIIVTELPGPELPREEAVALLDRINASASVGAVAVPLIAGYALAVLALPIALYRGRLVPLWAVAPAAGALAIEAVSLGGAWVAATKYALAFLSAAVVSGHLLRLSPSEWQDPPIVPVSRSHAAPTPPTAG